MPAGGKFWSSVPFRIGSSHLKANNICSDCFQKNTACIDITLPVFP